MLNGNQITVADFSTDAVNKAVKKAGIEHPVTVYPPAIGVCAIVYSLLFSEGFHLLIGGGVLVIIGLGNCLARMVFLKEKIATNFRRMKRKALAEQAKRATGDLESTLQSLGRHRAAKQVGYLRDTFMRFKDKLVDRIGKDRPEYEQYLGSAEVMYLAALKNLQAVKEYEQDKRLIDVKDTKDRIAELKAEQEKGQRDNTKEIEAQERQLKRVEVAENTCRDLVAEVEGTITTLTEETMGLSEIELDRKSLELSVGQAMKKFQHITQRNRQIFDRVAESWKKIQATY